METTVVLPESYRNQKLGSPVSPTADVKYLFINQYNTEQTQVLVTPMIFLDGILTRGSVLLKS